MHERVAGCYPHVGVVREHRPQELVASVVGALPADPAAVPLVQLVLMPAQTQTPVSPLSCQET